MKKLFSVIIFFILINNAHAIDVGWNIPELGTAFETYIVSPDKYPPGSGNVWRRKVVLDNETKEIRLHFHFDHLPRRSDWVINIEGSSNGVAISPSDVKGLDVWSGTIKGYAFIIELKSNDGKDKPQFTINKFIATVNEKNPESLIGPADWVFLKKTHVEEYSLGENVARLDFIKASTEKTSCSGFLVSDNIMMTNHHCISSTEECRTAIAEFKYDVEEEVTLKYRCIDVLIHDFDLDYTLILLEGSPGKGYKKLIASAIEPKGGENLFVIQHPDKDKKRISKEGCQILGTELEGRNENTNLDFGHTCDTKGGSSGSPVFLNNGSIIGLHHYGASNDDLIRRNQAVSMNHIVVHISTNIDTKILQEMQYFLSKSLLR